MRHTDKNGRDLVGKPYCTILLGYRFLVLIAGLLCFPSDLCVVWQIYWFNILHCRFLMLFTYLLCCFANLLHILVGVMCNVT